MTKENAIEIMKALINETIKKGLFENAEAVINVSNAFNLIATELTKENDA